MLRTHGRKNKILKKESLIFTTMENTSCKRQRNHWSI